MCILWINSDVVQLSMKTERHEKWKKIPARETLLREINTKTNVSAAICCNICSLIPESE